MAMKITTRQALKVSKLIGKLDLKIKDPKAAADEIGADLILQIAGKLGEAEDEIAEIISMLTGLPKEEALDADLMEIFEKEQGENGFISFFISAVKRRIKE
jgi:GGDEF domain-containing protein